MVLSLRGSIIKQSWIPVIELLLNSDESIKRKLKGTLKTWSDEEINSLRLYLKKYPDYLLYISERRGKLKLTTIKILESAGWYPNRNINIQEEIVYLKEKGYVMTESFCQFYKEFGKIGFYLSDVYSRERSIGFILEDAFDIEFDEVIIEDYPRIIGSQNLILIGHINRTSVLVIDEYNAIYSLYDGSVLKLGNNPSEALDNLCNVSWAELRAKGEYPIPDWW